MPSGSTRCHTLHCTKFKSVRFQNLQNHILILAENNWDCGCEASNFRHFIEVTGNAERFEKLVDEPVLNCTSPTQMIGQYLAGMPIRRGSKTNYRPDFLTDLIFKPTKVGFQKSEKLAQHRLQFGVQINSEKTVEVISI